jgi:geranylgeranyl diphosphate synthase type II
MTNWREAFLDNFEARLSNFLNVDTVQARLNSLLSYQFFPAGKRIRPMLIASIVKDLGCNLDLVIDPACGLEILHTASLIHDDLPCVDNDIERRGQPTLHVIAGEDKALLIGDFLIAKAYSISASATNLEPESRCQITEVLAKSFCQLCHGQILDVENLRRSEEEILEFYDLKTGALFHAAVEIARVITSSKSPEEFSGFSKAFGRAFQVQNDYQEILIGRETDKKNNRSTVLSLNDLKSKQKFLDSLVQNTWDKLQKLEKSLGSDSLNETRQTLKILF